MAPPLAASSSSSSEDEEVHKQVEEQKGSSAMKKPKSHSSSSSSDDDEESEESDSEPATPIASKPKKDAWVSILKPSSSDPKTSSNDDDDDETPSPKPKPITSKVSSNAKKHPLVSHKDSKLKKKKQKKVLDGNESDSKLKKKKQKKVFDGNVIIQRLWSDEDELVLLKGLIENKKEGGVDPLSNLKEFLESIKKSFKFKEVKQEQLINKIQRLRKKFVNSSKRAKGDAGLVFSKPHEQLSYTLMKEIWGVGGGNSVRTKCHAIPMMDLDDSNGDENAVKKGDLEQKWRCLIVDELKLYLRRVELVREQTVAIIDAHK